MKLALCQMASGADKAVNRDEITRLAERAAARGADLAVFPEYAMYDTLALSHEFVVQSEPLDGAFVQHLTELAKRLGVSIVAGMLETIPDEDRAYNSMLLVTPEDGLHRVYRKAHLYDAFGFKESGIIRPGALEGPVTCSVGGVEVGLLTCYDLRFPEAARQHADAGVDVLLYPAAWIPGPRKENHWNTLARARAIENTFYVVAVSQAPGVGVGGSLAVDPMGAVLAELAEEPGVAIVEIERDRIAEVRRKNPCLENRRFDVVPREQ